MVDADERIELLINRKLDNTLTGDEQLELDRALIRSPEHRRMLELSREIDELSREVLVRELGAETCDGSGDAVPVDGSHSIRMRSRFVWWLMPAALAASVVLMVWGGAFTGPAPDNFPGIVEGNPIMPDERVDSAAGGPRGFVGPGISPVDSRAGGIRRVSTAPDFVDRRRDSNVYGIVGDDGRIYLIELERTRMYRYPRSKARARLVRDDL